MAFVEDQKDNGSLSYFFFSCLLWFLFCAEVCGIVVAQHHFFRKSCMLLLCFQGSNLSVPVENIATFIMIIPKNKFRDKQFLEFSNYFNLNFFKALTTKSNFGGCGKRCGCGMRMRESMRMRDAVNRTADCEFMELVFESKHNRNIFRTCSYDRK